MTILRATVTLNKYTGIPEDAAVNVHHFETTTDPDEYAIDQSFVIANFYSALQAYLSPSLDPAANAHKIQWATVTPGAPGAGDDVTSAIMREDGFTMGAVGSLTTALPDEVACCLSLTGAGADTVPEESGSTRPRSRHRGRVYLGPLGRNCGYQTTAGEFRVAGAFQTAVLNAAETYLHDASVTNGGDWVVYSRQNAAAYPIESCWIDDAFDTIRSRGLAATARVTRLL